MSQSHATRRPTGKQCVKRQRRKGKGLSRKMRRKKMGNHRNKYVHLAPERRPAYSAEDKTFRTFYFMAEPGQTFLKGQLVLYHGRTYRLTENVSVGYPRLVGASAKLVGSSK